MIQNKQKEILISVIIPVYNVEQYVIECLESVLHQQDETIEIILVNDGSQDRSEDLCQRKLMEYPEHKIKMISQPNQGLSVARNNGLCLAKGKYVMFLDSDDMLSDNAFAKLKESIERYQSVDVFFFDARIQDETDEKTEKVNYTRENKVDSIVVTGKEYFCTYYLNPLIVSACMCLYKTEFIREKELVFTPGQLHEDIVFSFKTVLSAQSVLYIPDKLYIRRYRYQSITTERISSKHLFSQINAYEECLCRVNQIEPRTQMMDNALAEFFRIGLRYVFRTANKCGVDADSLSPFYAKLLKFYSLVKINSRGITYYKILEELFQYTVKYQYMDIHEIAALWKEITEVNTIRDMQEIFAEKLTHYYCELLEKFPLNIKSKKIGIYGMGKHTRVFLEKYQSLIGDIEAEIVFLDSEKESFITTYMEKEVINIRDVKGTLDMIIISSYLYHLEMNHLAEKYTGEIEIIDIYMQEKTALF